MAERNFDRLITQDIVQLLMLRANAGRSPKRNIAQSNALGKDT